ncbi:MAG: phage head-tail connector protein [Alphaproteobacteria bacterium]|nr:phage head-tail connector protein [Alphaproteobacteria bacterium]
MSLELTTPPATKPVTLAEAKAWLRVESGADEDDLIASLIPAARARAEAHTGRAFVTQHWTLWRDHAASCIAIPLPPLQDVSSVTVYAPDDGATVLSSGDYTVDMPGSRLLLKTMPFNLRPINAVAIAFTAGYGDAGDVPSPISQAILQIISTLYEHRGGDVVPTPDNALALLAPYRVMRL